MARISPIRVGIPASCRCSKNSPTIRSALRRNQSQFMAPPQRRRRARADGSPRSLRPHSRPTPHPPADPRRPPPPRPRTGRRAWRRAPNAATPLGRPACRRAGRRIGRADVRPGFRSRPANPGVPATRRPAAPSAPRPGVRAGAGPVPASAASSSSHATVIASVTGSDPARANDSARYPRSRPMKSATKSSAGDWSNEAGSATCANRPPGANTAMTSPRRNASSTSWVTKAMVLPSSACNRDISSWS